PSRLRTSMIATFNLLAGITVFSCRAWPAFRMRVSMSAIGSVTLAIGNFLAQRARTASPPHAVVRSRAIPSPLPGGLGHTSDLPAVGPGPETDAAHLELPEEGPRAPTKRAPVVLPHLELGLAGRCNHLRSLRHGYFPLISSGTASPDTSGARVPPRRCERSSRW